MRLGQIGRWAIRQALGTVNGTRLIAIIEAIRPEDIAALEQLLDIIRRRRIVDILDDLTILEQIDGIVGGDR
jgi:hypothetical protein